jgi:hypothetical protein
MKKSDCGLGKTDCYNVCLVSAHLVNCDAATATESRSAVLSARKLGLRPSGYSLGSAWLFEKRVLGFPLGALLFLRGFI